MAFLKLNVRSNVLLSMNLEVRETWEGTSVMLESNCMTAGHIFTEEET